MHSVVQTSDQKCRVLAPSAALKHHSVLWVPSGRAMTLSGGVFLLRGGWRVIEGLSQVVCRHMQAQGHACVCLCARCMFTEGRKNGHQDTYTQTHPGGDKIVGGWVAANCLPVAIKALPAGEKKTFRTHTHTHTKCPWTHMLRPPRGTFFRLSICGSHPFFEEILLLQLYRVDMHIAMNRTYFPT